MKFLSPSNPHSTSVVPYRYCAIDPGSRNLGIRVEDRIGNKIVTIYSHTEDLGQKNKKSAYESYIPSLFRYLDTIRDGLMTCQYIIVEMQIQFADITRIEALMVGYFMASMPGNTKIGIISPQSKNKLLSKYYNTKVKSSNAGKLALDLANRMLEASQQCQITSDHEADCCLMIEVAVTS